MPNLDLTSSAWTARERTDAIRYHERSHETGERRFAQFVPFSIEYNPAGFKRWWASVPGRTRVVPRDLLLAHLCAAIGNSHGCLLGIVGARVNAGLTKRQVVETLNFAFWTGGAESIDAVAESIGPYLASWEDECDDMASWPEGWVADPDSFKSGIDHSTTGFTSTEIEALKRWQRRMTGEVPRYVELWARLDGQAYKANRVRFELAIGRTMPVQVFALMSLHLAAHRERIPSLRQSLLHCRALGVALEHVVEVMSLVFDAGGELQMAAVLTDEIADMLEGWPGTPRTS